MKKARRIRHIVQLICTALGNGYLLGFSKAKIFQGNSKMVCVPFLNCYSCPGAVCACPIGSLQAVLGDRNFKFSFYVLGTIMLFGILLGRLICGFLCPFGFIQDLLHKIKTPKLKVKPSIDKPLRYLKYIILLVFVFLLPIFLTDSFGIGAPYFCKWICPAGTLEGGVPLVLLQKGLRNTIGFLFYFKGTILIGIIILSVVIYRPFCKYICPLGALYGLFNKLSFFKLAVDEHKCTGCGACERVCQMEVPVMTNCNSAECIRCGECKHACPHGAIEFKGGIFK